MGHGRYILTAGLTLGALLLTGNTSAETSKTCAGFLDSLPTTITTQGVWCLKKDLSTNLTTGAAIIIATNNVTIDCNNFKIGGLAAGSGTSTNGITAHDRQNVTVRNCNIRGFLHGINIQEGSGHVVERNRLDNNTLVGVTVMGTNTLVLQNRVYDTGGSTAWNGTTSGIRVNHGDVRDNIVAGVINRDDSIYGHTRGIYVNKSDAEVSGNIVRGLMKGRALESTNIGIETRAASVVKNNHVVALEPGTKIGIKSSINKTACMDNTVINFQAPMVECADGGGNHAL